MAVKQDFLFEELGYDAERTEDNGFYIKVTKLNQRQEVARKPLSAWNLTKEASGTVIIRRELPSLGVLETQTISELYSVKISYKVNSKNKEIYLKTHVQLEENDSKTKRIYITDVNLGRTQQVPLPTKLFVASDWEQIEIKKGKGKLITQKQAVEILKSGECLGIYSDDLTRKFI